MRWKLGVWIGPPNVLLAPKPTSSVKIKRMFGEPAGASYILGKSGVESLTVRPIFPSNGGRGLGSTEPSLVAATAGCCRAPDVARLTSIPAACVPSDTSSESALNRYPFAGTHKYARREAW